MKKFGLNFPNGNRYTVLKKGLIVMKISMLLILISSLNLLATGTYSQTTRVTLKLNQTSVKQVLKEIERSSEFHFLYNNDLIDVERKVDIKADNEQINTILDELFANQKTKYAVYDRQIVISPAEMPLPQPDQRKISGKVSDNSGIGLPGVSVVVKGTTTGITTDANGNFTLPKVPSNAILVFSFVGMKTQEVKVTGDNTVNVKMEEETIGIDEVVAIGYGTVKKKDLTGSVSSISSKDIGIAPVSNLAQILQGKASGVSVTPVGGSPGADVNVRIRGLGTVNSNDPLYVIDGIPSTGMNNLNPNDIESIDILKDASASAIYGSRAASGVVLITTKKGATGVTKIAFESYLGVSTPSKSPRQLNADQYYQMVKTADANGGTTDPVNLESEYQQGHNTNWWDEMTRKGTTQNYYVSASGGSEKMRYAFSGGYFKQEGTIKGTDFDRFTFRTNTDYNITKKLKVGMNLGITNSTRDVIPEGWTYNFGTVAQSGIMDPLVPVINPDADINDPNYQFNKFGFGRITDAANPVGIIARTFNKSKSLETLGNAYFDLTILDGLVYRMNIGVDINIATLDQFSPQFFLTPSENNATASISRSYAQSKGVVFDNILTYTKKIGDHSLSAVAAFTSEEHKFDGFNGSKQGTLSNDEAFRVLSAATSSPQISGTKSSSSLLSYLGRVNYNFKDKYLVTASMRRDGSSRFASGHNWGVFPSVALGWKINEENFFKGLNTEFVDLLKLRGGWGQIGNQNIADNAFLSLIQGGNGNRYIIGGVPLQGYAPSAIGNPNIKWETVESTNLGIDANLFRNKITISADYYNKNTKDMLLQVPRPKYSGYQSDPWSNAGSISNTGWEFQLGYRNKISDFNYEVAVNLTTIKNEVTSLGSQGAIYGGQCRLGQVTRTAVGHPIGAFYGYVMDGIFQNDAEVTQGHQPTAKPGDVRFKDIAGPLDSNGKSTGPDGVIDGQDLTYIGNPNPDLLLGFNINLKYKNFDFGVFFQGVLGNELYNSAKLFTYQGNGSFNMSEYAYTHAWNGEGTSNSIPRITSTQSNDNFRNSSFYIEDGSYLRMKNIQLGYALPASVCQAMHISNLRLFVSGQNLAIFTKYSGLDPEIGSNVSLLNVGIDYGTYPQPKTVMGGVSINF